MGSSTTDEYQFSPLHPTARDWVEILGPTRGWNFGSFTTVSRGEPRNQGYEYNWARVGATTASLLTQGQHTGLAAQVASGDVTLAVLWIGTNDFRNVLLAPGQQHLPATVVPNAVANFTTALNTVLAADPNVRMIVATTYDERILPYVPQRIQQGMLTQALVNEVSVGIQQYNAQITAIASHDSRVAVADLYGLFKGIIAADQFSVGGLTLDRRTADAAPDHLFVDQFHPWTIGQALIANSFLDAINTSFDAGVPRLNDQEILRAASVPEPTTLMLLGVGVLCSLSYAWLCQKSAGSASARRSFDVTR
jgi:phospholipase/lecithinase/hemolysin